MFRICSSAASKKAWLRACHVGEKAGLTATTIQAETPWCVEEYFNVFFLSMVHWALVEVMQEGSKADVRGTR